ncbi:MAG: hypothetical protein IJU04_01985 [Ruminococcus sp.]|nr:hypothetical protein [Ruminococcus sp.]
MERKCSACGARISDNMKICANCGKVVPPLRAKRPVNQNPQRQQVNRSTQNRPAQPQRQVSSQRPASAVKSAPARSSQRVNTQTFTPERKHTHPPKKQPVPKPRKTPARQVTKSTGITKEKIFKGLKIALIVLIVYVVISVIQVFRVRFATYDFKSDMKMTAENYGQAIDNSFDSGMWYYNPITFTVTYKGEKKHEEDYELKFSAFIKVRLKSVSVGDKEKTGNKMESAIMGLFMNEPTEHDD